MNEQRPAISVVLAVHNGEKFLAETLRSIVNQTMKDFECIIINDFSTDGTKGILDEFSSKDARLKVYDNEVNLRLARSLNRGLELSSGKYIIRMDADDICLPDRFERQFAFMEEHPDISVSYCKFFTLRDGEINIGACGRRCDADSVRAMLLLFNPVLHPGVIARAEDIKAFAYAPECSCSEDLDIWTRMVLSGKKIACNGDYLMLYRLHGGQITATTNTKQREEVAKIQKKFYGETLFELSDEEMDFYITRAYFRDEKDVKGLYDFYRKIIKANRKTKEFSSPRIRDAFIEILADYKRISPLSFADKARLLLFGGFSFVAELRNRKKRAAEDISKACAAAEKAGFARIQKAGTLPVFTISGGERQ